MKRLWTNAENATLRDLYPRLKTSEVAARMGRGIGSVYQHAAVLGITKSAEYLASADACRLRRGDKPGWAHRFPKGNKPWNAGLVGWRSGGRSAETQFKKGNRPHTWRPIGSTRTCKHGYLEIKVSDTGNKKRDWAAAHVLLWREHCDPIPPGHAVVFKDRDRKHITIENLELVSRRRLMERNTVHRLPKELALAIQLMGALRRQIRSKDNGEKHTARPA